MNKLILDLGNADVLVLDTETFGINDKRVYNIGWVIHHADGTPVVARNYLVKQFWENLNLMQSAYYANKIALYNKRIAEGADKVVYFGTILNILKKDLQRCTPMSFAFNSRFDNASIDITCKYFGKENPFDAPILDIMDYLEPICGEADYIDFCESNGFMTKHKTPKPQRKAETLFAFMTNNPDYAEEHTALEDSKIEYEIIREVARRLAQCQSVSR